MSIPMDYTFGVGNPPLLAAPRPTSRRPTGDSWYYARRASVLAGAYSMALDPDTAPQAMASRYFSLFDDMTFTNSGQPDTGTPAGSTPIQRGGRYTWAYCCTSRSLLRPVRPGPHHRRFRRPATTLAAANRLLLPSDPLGVANLPTSTSVLLLHNGMSSTVRRGTWILHTSYDDPRVAGSVRLSGAVQEALYRVASVTRPTPRT